MLAHSLMGLPGPLLQGWVSWPPSPSLTAPHLSLLSSRHCVSDLCATHDPKEQEELRCQVLSGYASICQEAGATPASWRDHTHCGEALTCPSSWPLTPSALSTPCSALSPHSFPHLGFLSWFPQP